MQKPLRPWPGRFLHLEAKKLDFAQFECGILHFQQEKPNSAFHASEAFVFWGIAVSFCTRL